MKIKKMKEVGSSEIPVCGYSDVSTSFIDFKKNIFRVPHTFCVGYEDRLCDEEIKEILENSDKYYELDLVKYELPVDILSSITISPDHNKIAYSVNNNSRIFILSLETKIEKEITQKFPDLESISISKIRKFSPSSRFLIFKNCCSSKRGGTEFPYDTKVQSFIDDISPYFYFFGDNDKYAIYLDVDSSIENTIPSPATDYDTIKIKNNDTEEAITIIASNNKYGYILKQIKGNDLTVEKYWYSEEYEYQSEIETIDISSFVEQIK